MLVECTIEGAAAAQWELKQPLLTLYGDKLAKGTSLSTPGVPSQTMFQHLPCLPPPLARLLHRPRRCPYVHKQVHVSLPPATRPNNALRPRTLPFPIHPPRIFCGRTTSPRRTSVTAYGLRASRWPMSPSRSLRPPSPALENPLVSTAPTRRAAEGGGPCVARPAWAETARPVGRLARRAPASPCCRPCEPKSWGHGGRLDGSETQGTSLRATRPPTAARDGERGAGVKGGFCGGAGRFLRCTRTGSHDSRSSD
jgi:hypothetical protein